MPAKVKEMTLKINFKARIVILIFEDMKKLLYLIIPIALIGCDDGDLILEDLDFESSTVQACDIPEDDDISDYLFYMINDTETISLQLSTTDNILSTQATYGPYSLITNDLEYRKLSDAAGSDYYCNDIPPSSPTTLQTFIGEDGDVYITTSIEEEDNDGISAVDEGIATLQDTDMDGLPDYIDEDDDGDNVLTINEGINLTDLSLSQDTDGDGTPDYLDNDDDGDGILTIQEDLNRDLSPANDRLLVGTDLQPYYLINSTQTASPAIDSFIPHEYSNTASLDIAIEDLNATSDSREIIIAFYEFGTFVRTVTKTITPNFVP
ncbi:hypothetical protein JCM19298_879 [Nonlabens ulvanivorans]|nr:hypothetical protein JCM19298_879 [Nonlabens ulvanivorans]